MSHWRVERLALLNSFDLYSSGRLLPRVAGTDRVPGLALEAEALDGQDADAQIVRCDRLQALPHGQCSATLSTC
jgi:hypothetical protein